MSREVAILEAAFALRDSGTASTETGTALRAALPAALADVDESERLKLSGDVLRELASDRHALAFIAAHIAGTAGIYKSFVPRIEVEPPGVSTYVCPVDGKHPWSRPDKSYEIPKCSEHGVALVLKTKP